MLGARIRKAREAQKMTQAELAGRAGVTQSYIAYLERGTRTPSLARLQRLARALKTNVSTLLK